MKFLQNSSCSSGAIALTAGEDVFTMTGARNASTRATHSRLVTPPSPGGDVLMLNQRFIPTTDFSQLTRTFELRLFFGGSHLFCLKNCEGQAREMCESFFFKFETFSSQIFTFTIYLLLFHHGRSDNRMGTSPHGTPDPM